MEQRKILMLGVLLLTLHSVNCDDILYCPEPCLCHVEGMSFIVDCSGQELTELPTLHYKNIQYLDLSKNLLKTFPDGIKELDSLEVLDISDNLISTVPADSLEGLSLLRVFDLSHNEIENWIDINPNSLLIPTYQLREFSLAYNKLSSFTSLDEKLVLISNSLELLDLSGNNIAKVTGDEVLQGLTNLRKLKLNENPILSMVDLASNSLLSLELRDCGLSTLKPTFLSKLPMLTAVDLSKNPHLALAGKDRRVVQSESLRRIDLSYCNQEHFQLEGFPNLTYVNLSHNMIKELNDKSLSGNMKIEGVELAMNMIGAIHPLAFKGLILLKFIDLSFNSIQSVDRNLFKDNQMLTDVNLSYNYINRLLRLNAPSVTKLNFSHCEVFAIERNVLDDMSEIVDLDLSFNILSDLPPYMESQTLQNLNLKNNRIANIRNTSFMNLHSLTTLNLVGNRLTTPFKRQIFSYNPYLQEIWLGDNPWICDCHNKQFHEFYRYLTEPPRKAYDLGKATCYSPEQVYGLSWETACYKHWYPHDRYMGSSEKIWMSLMIVIFGAAIIFFVVAQVKKQLDKRQERQNEEEREATETEAASIARQTRMRLQQEAQLNAPDPRDTHPPCYEDAIRMPKPFFYSMDELSTTRKQKRRKHRLLKQSSEETEEVTTDTRASHRFHSEELLSSTSRVPPRLHPFEMEALERTRPDALLTPNSERILEQIEEIMIFNSRQNSPYSRRRNSSGSRSRRNGSSGSINRSKDSFQRIGSLRRLTEKPEPSNEDLKSVTSASSLSNTFVDVRPSKKSSAASSRLEMSDEAGKYLEEEVQLLEEVEKLKRQQQKSDNQSDSSSDGEDIEVIKDEEVGRVVRKGTNAEVEVHRRMT